jgi:hypothetical protein
MVKKQRKCSLSETYFGYVETLLDSLILFNAVINNKLPTIQKRLSRVERRSIISGSVFVFKEDEAGIKRWTDGRYWSPSRILGDYLVYIELDDPRKTNKWANRKNKAKDKKEIEDPVLKNEELQMKKIKYKGIIPSLDLKKFNIRQNGLIKKTLSAKVEGKIFHLISYYHEQDVSYHTINTPSSDEELLKLYKECGNKNIEILNFRTNKKQQINMNQLTLQNPNWCVDNDVSNIQSNTNNNSGTNESNVVNRNNYAVTNNNIAANNSNNMINNNNMNNFNANAPTYQDPNLYKNGMNMTSASPQFIYGSNMNGMPPNMAPNMNGMPPNMNGMPPNMNGMPPNMNQGMNGMNGMGMNGMPQNMNGMPQQAQQQANNNPQQNQPQPIYGITYGGQQQNMSAPPQQAQTYAKDNQISNPFIISQAPGNGNNNNTNSSSSIKTIDNNFDRSHSLLFMEKPPQAQQNQINMIEQQNPAQNAILMNEPSQNPQSQTPNSILMNDSQLPPQQQSNGMPNNFNPFLIQTPLMQNEANANTYYQQNRQTNDINLVNTFNNTPPILNNKNNSPSMAFRSLQSPTMNQQNNQQNFTGYSHNSQAVVHQQSLPTPNSTPTTAPIVPVMQKAAVNPNQPTQQIAISSFPPHSTIINNQNQNMASTAVTTQQNNAPAWGGNNMNNTQMVHTQVINDSQNSWNSGSPPIINQNNQNIYQGIANNSNWQPNYNNDAHANTQNHENVIYY